MTKPGLIVFSGLPGAGKTTLSRLVAAQIGAVFLRIDTIEAALRNSLNAPLSGPEGYLVAGAMAHDQLALGRRVIIDAVNDDTWCQTHWEGVAARAQAPVAAVLVVCSDQDEHRRRVEARLEADPDAGLPDWPAVQSREFSDWDQVGLTVDTARLAPEACADQISGWLIRSGMAERRTNP